MTRCIEEPGPAVTGLRKRWLHGRSTRLGHTGESQGPTKRGAIHLVMRGKGGVGKSPVLPWLAEYSLPRRKKVWCIDGDPVNRSLALYAALHADKLDPVNSDVIVDRTRYDVLFERFATEESTFLLDSGATVFLPLWSYIVETEMIRVLRDVGRRWLSVNS